MTAEEKESIIQEIYNRISEQKLDISQLPIVDTLEGMSLPIIKDTGGDKKLVCADFNGTFAQTIQDAKTATSKTEAAINSAKTATNNAIAETEKLQSAAQKANDAADRANESTTQIKEDAENAKISAANAAASAAAEKKRAMAIEKRLQDNSPAISNEAGFYVLDSQKNIGMVYNQDGLDVALLSKHFENLIKAIEGVGPKIINDLTTGGVNNPLSAEQGKVLKEIFDSISSIKIGTTSGTAYDGKKGTELFIKLLKIEALLANFKQVAEEGIYFIDENGYITSAITENGFKYVGQITYEIVE